MTQATTTQPNMEYRRSPDEWSQLRAEWVRAAVEKQAPTAVQQAPKAKERQPVMPPEEDTLPAVSKEAAANTRFYRRVCAAEVMLSGDVLLANEAYMRTRAKKALEGVAEDTAGSREAHAIATGERSELTPATGCETCEARRYQDGSDDSGVSFQSPAGMPASLSGVRVAAHEGEHVARESAEANAKGELLLDKHVTMEMRFCPDCGRMYAAGGKTTIQKVSSNEGEGNVAVREAEDALAVGDKVDTYI